MSSSTFMRLVKALPGRAHDVSWASQLIVVGSSSSSEFFSSSSSELFSSSSEVCSCEGPDAFVMSVVISADFFLANPDGKSQDGWFALPLRLPESNQVAFCIDWGDGTLEFWERLPCWELSEHGDSSLPLLTWEEVPCVPHGDCFQLQGLVHRYAAEGTYTVRMCGEIGAPNFHAYPYHGGISEATAFKLAVEMLDQFFTPYPYGDNYNGWFALPLRLAASGRTDFCIDWGDGTLEHWEYLACWQLLREGCDEGACFLRWEETDCGSESSTADCSLLTGLAHQYAAPGTYLIAISGEVGAPNFNGYPYNDCTTLGAVLAASNLYPLEAGDGMTSVASLQNAGAFRGITEAVDTPGLLTYGHVSDTLTQLDQGIESIDTPAILTGGYTYQTLTTLTVSPESIDTPATLTYGHVETTLVSYTHPADEEGFTSVGSLISATLEEE